MSGRLRWLQQQGEQLEWDWSKLPQQRDFLGCTSTFSMYSGGFGTGKTSVLCAKIIACLIMIPNNLGYLGRLDGKSLKQSTMIVMEELLDSEFIKSNNKQEGVLQIDPKFGGSKLLYGDFKDMNDLKNLPLGFFAIDQCEEVVEEVWLFLAGRLRRKIPILDPETGLIQFRVTGERRCEATVDGKHFALGKDAQYCLACKDPLPEFNQTMVEGIIPWDTIIYPRYGFGVCNPENPEHWIYETFPNLPGYKGDISKGKEGYSGFSATTYDALKAGFVDREYVRNMEISFGHVPLMIDRYLWGKWVLAEGLVYPGFSKTTHCYNTDPVRFDGTPLINEHTVLFEYIDYGSTSVTAVGWVLMEACSCGCGKHNYYVHREHYVADQPVGYHAKAIKNIRKDIGHTVQASYLDAQCFSKTFSKRSSSNEEELSSIAESYMDEDIFVLKNQKDWDSGWNIITELLAVDPAHTHPITGEMGAPHLLVSKECPELIKEFGTYKWKKVRPGQPIKEEPQDGNDHHMDGLNGFLSGKHEQSVSLPEPKDQRTEFQKMLDEEKEELFGPLDGEITPGTHMSL